jgi:hypothetical protein
MASRLPSISIAAMAPSSPGSTARIDLQRLDVIIAKNWKGVEAGEAGPSLIALKAIEQRRRILGLGRSDTITNILVQTGGTAEQRGIDVRFLPSNGNGGATDVPLKQIEHRAEPVNAANAATATNADEPYVKTSNYYDPKFTDAGKFAERRLEQLDFERQSKSQLVEERDRLRAQVEMAKVTVGPRKHQDALMGGDELRGSCDQAPPKPRRERIIG